MYALLNYYRDKLNLEFDGMADRFKVQKDRFGQVNTRLGHLKNELRSAIANGTYCKYLASIKHEIE